MYWPHAAMVTYAIGSVISGVLGRHLGPRNPMGVAWALVSLMCLFFAGAWGFVAFDGSLDRGDWSRTVTPVSTLFTLIFTLPALITLVYRRGYSRWK